MNEQMQAMAFFAGANSIFYGEKLLTTANPEADKDKRLFNRLGIEPEPYSAVEERREGSSVSNTGSGTVGIFEPVAKAAIQQTAPETPLFYNAAS
jgi:biotin synthase